MKLQIGFLTERLILGFGVDLAVHQYASYLQGQGHDVTVFFERHEPIVERKYRVIDLGQRADSSSPYLCRAILSTLQGSSMPFQWTSGSSIRHPFTT